VDEASLPCWTCAARLAYDVAHGHWSWDPATKLYYNDPPGKPREYIDRQCNLTDAAGNIRRKAFDQFGKWPEHEQGLCPVEMLTCPSPSPAPSPTPSPSSSPTPQPPGGGTAPPIDPATGNYPLPPDLVCPAWFADSLLRVGIHVAGQVPCAQGTVCRRVTLWATPKSVPPYCPHAADRRECEQWRPCQLPQFIDYVGEGENPGGGILMQIKHPDWGNVWGRLDKQTCDPRHDACPPGMANPVHNYNGHDKAVDRSGETSARACLPDATKCSQTSYRTDQ
jgi:hypothetical protein